MVQVVGTEDSSLRSPQTDHDTNGSLVTPVGGGGGTEGPAAPEIDVHEGQGNAGPEMESSVDVTAHDRVRLDRPDPEASKPEAPLQDISQSMAQDANVFLDITPEVWCRFIRRISKLTCQLKGDDALFQGVELDSKSLSSPELDIFLQEPQSTLSLNTSDNLQEGSQQLSPLSPRLAVPMPVSAMPMYSNPPSPGPALALPGSHSRRRPPMILTLPDPPSNVLLGPAGSPGIPTPVPVSVAMSPDILRVLASRDAMDYMNGSTDFESHNGLFTPEDGTSVNVSASASGGPSSPTHVQHNPTSNAANQMEDSELVNETPENSVVGFPGSTAFMAPTQEMVLESVDHLDSTMALQPLPNSPPPQWELGMRLTAGHWANALLEADPYPACLSTPIYPGQEQGEESFDEEAEEDEEEDEEDSELSGSLHELEMDGSLEDRVVVVPEFLDSGGQAPGAAGDEGAGVINAEASVLMDWREEEEHELHNVPEREEPELDTKQHESAREQPHYPTPGFDAEMNIMEEEEDSFKLMGSLSPVVASTLR